MRRTYITIRAFILTAVAIACLLFCYALAHSPVFEGENATNFIKALPRKKRCSPALLTKNCCCKASRGERALYRRQGGRAHRTVSGESSLYGEGGGRNQLLLLFARARKRGTHRGQTGQSAYRLQRRTNGGGHARHFRRILMYKTGKSRSSST